MLPHVITVDSSVVIRNKLWRQAVVGNTARYELTQHLQVTSHQSIKEISAKVKLVNVLRTGRQMHRYVGQVVCNTGM